MYSVARFFDILLTKALDYWLLLIVSNGCSYQAFGFKISSGKLIHSLSPCKICGNVSVLWIFIFLRLELEMRRWNILLSLGSFEYLDSSISMFRCQTPLVSLLCHFENILVNLKKTLNFYFFISCIRWSLSSRLPLISAGLVVMVANGNSS